MNKPMRCFLDCETTGLDASKNAIIQLGIVIPDVNATLNLLIKPHRGCSFTAEAAKITGFTKEELMEDPKRLSIEEAAWELERFMKKHYGSKKAPAVAHNSAFDRGFIQAWLKRAKVVKFANLTTCSSTGIRK